MVFLSPFQSNSLPKETVRNWAFAGSLSPFSCEKSRQGVTIMKQARITNHFIVVSPWTQRTERCEYGLVFLRAATY